MTQMSVPSSAKFFMTLMCKVEGHERYQYVALSVCFCTCFYDTMHMGTTGSKLSILSPKWQTYKDILKLF